MSKEMRVSVRLANSKEATAAVATLENDQDPLAGAADPKEGFFDPLVGFFDPLLGRKTPALVGPGRDGRTLRVQIEGQKAGAVILQIDSSGLGERLLKLFDAEKRVALTAEKAGDELIIVFNHEEQ